jgi:UDP-N-acetylmuramate dehydrogenase
MNAAIDNRLHGQLLLNEPLARHTSWRVGGPADRLYRPAGRSDLIELLQQLEKGEPLFWLGLGSNLLVRDGGIRGTVVAPLGGLRSLVVDGVRIFAECGVGSPQLARLAHRQQLVGAEFLAGIPGTIGGALAMNAGAFGGEIWSLIESVETIDRCGRVRRRTPADYRIGYRSVAGPADEWFISATLLLKRGENDQRIAQLLQRRSQTQPLGEASCGSVFRNPPGDHAARLIESAGLKGLRIGAAEVSHKHANFIVNTGGATAADIEELIEAVRERVEAHHHCRLECEVVRVGERLRGESLGN